MREIIVRIPVTEKIKVTFRFVGKDVKPEHVTECVGIEPTATRQKGEKAKTHPERPYSRGYWGVDSDSPPTEPLSVHIHQLLQLLEPHKDAIELLAKEGYRPNFYCGIFYTTRDGYVMLEPQILKRVAEIGASIDIHIYKIEDDSLSINV